MKTNIFSKLLCALGTFILGFSFFAAHNSESVKADELPTNRYILYYGEDDYDLPLTIYICELNIEDELVYRTKEWKSSTQVGNEFVYQTHQTAFTITNQATLDAFLNELDYYVFNIDQEAYDLADDPEDALGTHFLIFSYYDQLLDPGDYIQAKNLYELYDFGPDILVCINPNEYRMDKTKFRLEDIQSPVISIDNNVLITNYDNPITLNEIKGLITAYDNQDGDITDRIVLVEDNYTNADKSTLGSYSVIFEVTDDSNNTSTLTINVKVEDITNPVLTVPGQITSLTSNPLNLNDTKALCTVSDNHDSTNSLINNIKIVSEKYTGNEHVPGLYEVVYSLNDSSGNIVYKSSYINVVDKSKPTISGSKTYTKSITATLRVSTIMEGLTANDDVDGNISDKITVKQDNYTVNAKTAGEYTVVFTVKDSNNNVSKDFVVTITVTDDVLPVFYVDNTIINVTEYEAMSHQDIVDFLIDTSAINRTPKKISFVCDEYSKNSSTPGTYKVSLKVDYEGQESEIINLNVNVLEDDGGYEDVKKETENFFTKILSFFKNLFAKLIEILTKIFQFIHTLF